MKHSVESSDSKWHRRSYLACSISPTTVVFNQTEQLTGYDALIEWTLSPQRSSALILSSSLDPPIHAVILWWEASRCKWASNLSLHAFQRSVHRLSHGQNRTGHDCIAMFTFCAQSLTNIGRLFASEWDIRYCHYFVHRDFHFLLIVTRRSVTSST